MLEEHERPSLLVWVALWWHYPRGMQRLLKVGASSDSVSISFMQPAPCVCSHQARGLSAHSTQEHWYAASHGTWGHCQRWNMFKHQLLLTSS
jgi:hypothetical protein